MKRALTFLAAILAIAALNVIACAQSQDLEARLERDRQETRERMASCGYTEVAPAMPCETGAEIDQETYDLAYSDLDSASPEQREKILDAREAIIWASEWQDDDSCFVKSNSETKTWYELPRFSELFPGWDKPRAKAAEEPEEPETAAERAAREVIQGIPIVYNRTHLVPTFVPHTITPSFQ